MGSKATSDFRRRRKENLIQVCGGKCLLCGYNKSNSALEFHHIDKTQKLYSIAANGTCHDLEKDLSEIQKCILVCANCHREIHDGEYSIQELENKKFYNEEIANQLRLEKQKKVEKTLYFCSSCGKQLYNKNITGLCEECYKASQRVGRPTREELKFLIRNMPFTKIGEQFGISDNGIRKWCKADNLPHKKTEINAYTDEQWSKI